MRACVCVLGNGGGHCAENSVEGNIKEARQRGISVTFFFPAQGCALDDAVGDAAQKITGDRLGREARSDIWTGRKKRGGGGGGVGEGGGGGGDLKG